MPQLSTCKALADRLTEHYPSIEVRDEGNGRVVYRATRRPIGIGTPRR
jgi:hypothetical protein